MQAPRLFCSINRIIPVYFDGDNSLKKAATRCKSGKLWQQILRTYLRWLVLNIPNLRESGIVRDEVLEVLRCRVRPPLTGARKHCEFDRGGMVLAGRSRLDHVNFGPSVRRQHLQADKRDRGVLRFRCLDDEPRRSTEAS